MRLAGMPKELALTCPKFGSGGHFAAPAGEVVKIALLSKHYTMLTQLLGFFYVEKTFRALVCQVCGNYSKLKS